MLPSTTRSTTLRLSVFRLGVLIAIAAAGLHATTLYTDLGPGQSFPQNGYTDSGSNIVQATQFTLTASGELFQILVPIYNATGSITFRLYTDSGGQPGSILESWANTAVPTNPAPIPIQTLASVVNPMLSAGTTYWFEAIAGATTNQTWAEGVVNGGGIWTGNPSPLVQDFAASKAVAIELDGFPVPEPGSWLLFGCGMWCVWAWRTARRKSRERKKDATNATNGRRASEAGTATDTATACPARILPT